MFGRQYHKPLSVLLQQTTINRPDRFLENANFKHSILLLFHYASDPRPGHPVILGLAVLHSAELDPQHKLLKRPAPDRSQLHFHNPIRRSQPLLLPFSQRRHLLRDARHSHAVYSRP
jgi:hypothetical protein